MTGLMGAAGLNDIWVALIALCGTVIGSFSGIIVSNKLVNYRLGLRKVGTTTSSSGCTN